MIPKLERDSFVTIYGYIYIYIYIYAFRFYYFYCHDLWSAVCWGGENTCLLELFNKINVSDVRGLLYTY